MWGCSCGAGTCAGVVSGIGVSGASADMGSICGLVAEGANACAGDLEGVGACMADANAGATGIGACLAQVGVCGLVACIALPVGGNW